MPVTNKISFRVTGKLTQITQLANIYKFRSLVTLYFSSVFNILTRQFNIHFGCFDFHIINCHLYP
jgi:hypothetical protein